MNSSAAHSRKDAAISFLTLAASGNVREAFSTYVSPGLRHHNPYFTGDAEALMLAMAENAAKNPGKVFEVKRAIEDGQLVAIHSHVRQSAAEPGAAVVHIFRFDDDRIVELWDIGQPVPKDSPNTNGMF